MRDNSYNDLFSNIFVLLFMYNLLYISSYYLLVINYYHKKLLNDSYGLMSIIWSMFELNYVIVY